jgi:peroxiredoxin
MIRWKSLVTLLLGGRIMPKLQAGMPAPTFTLPAMNGQSYALADALKKGPVVAAFFKISCPVCQFTFPFLERMYEAYGDSNITFWGISQDNAADTREFVDEFGVKFAALLDTDHYRVSNQYGLTMVPSIFLIQPDGRIQTASMGFAKRDLENIGAEIAKNSRKPEQPVFRHDEKVPEYRPG